MGAVYLQNGVCLLPKTDDHTFAESSPELPHGRDPDRYNNHSLAWIATGAIISVELTAAAELFSGYVEIVACIMSL